MTVAVLMEGGRWRYLAVTVVADQGGLVVAGEPALVPAPGRASWQNGSAAADDEDATLSDQLRPSLAAFFTAYARSDQGALAYYAAPGARLSGLGGTVQLGELRGLVVAQGLADRRTALASVRWRDPGSGAGLEQRYRLALVRLNGKWLVGDVAPEGESR